MSTVREKRSAPVWCGPVLALVFVVLLAAATGTCAQARSVVEPSALVTPWSGADPVTWPALAPSAATSPSATSSAAIEQERWGHSLRALGGVVVALGLLGSLVAMARWPAAPRRLRTGAGDPAWLAKLDDGLGVCIKLVVGAFVIPVLFLVCLDLAHCALGHVAWIGAAFAH
jgi:hypothetical protein